MEVEIVHRFRDVVPLWEKLWPNEDKRHLKIMSSMQWITQDSDYNMEVYEIYDPTFFGIRVDGVLVGINSGHRSSEKHYRSRGLYVEPEYRKQGFASLLLQATIEQAKKEKCEMVWSVPRRSAETVYLKEGFIQRTPWLDEYYSGENCYVNLKI